MLAPVAVDLPSPCDRTRLTVDSRPVQRVLQGLGVAWATWKRIAHVIGTFQARVLLTVLYVVLVAPIAILVRMVADPLRLARHSESYWVPVGGRAPRDVEAARRQS